MMGRLLSLNPTVFLTLLLPQSLWAGTFEPGVYEIEKDGGGTEQFQAEMTEDGVGHPQVVWWRIEDRLLSPDTRVPVLFGRDLDGNGKPDAWFYRDSSGLLESQDRPARRTDGWDAAHSILARELRTPDRWIVAVGLNAVFSQLSFTIGQLNQVEATILQEELNLKTLEIQIQRLAHESPQDQAIPLLQGVVSRGYADLTRRLETEEMRDLYVSLAGDTALLLLTGGSGQLLARAEVWVSSRLGTSSAVTAARATLSRITAGMSARAATLGGRLATQALARAEVQALLRLAPKEAVRVALSGLFSRVKIAKAAGMALTEGSAIVRAGASQWKYILLAQSLQIGAEALARGDEIVDPNPIVMTRKMASNEEFMQNFLYMSVETFGMASLSTYFQTPGKRVLSCALFSLTDSTLMNYAIKGSVNPERQALDTGWEVIVGNAQTQIDMAALRSVENAVQRTGNPRLRLLGYMVVVVDQGAGYLGYSRAVSALEHHQDEQQLLYPQEVETHLVPVMGPL